MIWRSIHVFIPFMALLFSACLEDNLTAVPGTGDFSTSHQPIINGVPTSEPHHDAVVSLHEKIGNFVYVAPYCNGTLIAEDVVMTAAHCVDVAPVPSEDFSLLSANRLLIYVGDQPDEDLLAHLYWVDEIKIHPLFDRLGMMYDIALIRLLTPVTEVDPVPYLPEVLGFTDSDIGEDLNIVGFGTTAVGIYGVKLQIDVSLAGFGCAVPGCGGVDSPTTQISYSQSTGGPCSGDSGGPAFIERDGTWYAAGITSYGDIFCDFYGVSTRVDAFQRFIENFTGVSADCSSDGFCNEDCFEPVDPDCEEEEEEEIPFCGNGTCDLGESCNGFSGSISCIEDCPGNLEGPPSMRFCFFDDTCRGGGCP